VSELVRVPLGDNAADTAAALLEAAEKKDHGPEVIRLVSSSEGNEFEVPEDVAKAAKVKKAEEGPSVEEQAKADQEANEQEAQQRREEAGVKDLTVPLDPEEAKQGTAKKTAKKTAQKKQG
jgi:hypothetical protein